MRKAVVAVVSSLMVVGALPAGLLGSGKAAAADGSAYDHTFQSIDGKPMPLSSFRGKVLLIVNTASFCGFTPQYTALQKLYETYDARGLVVVGVPSNDFGGQEPKSDAEVKAFCQGAFGITFPLTAKYHVTGREKHSFYAWAGSSLGSMNAPWWNFHKYLVGRDGKLVSSFGTRTEPQAPNVIAAIEAELAKPAPPVTQ
ncbi:MAG: glutathione peroxidase [Hyphomicrobiaceae bacterium]